MPHLDDFQNKDSEEAPKTNFENRKSEKQQNNQKIRAKKSKPATDTDLGSGGFKAGTDTQLESGTNAEFQSDKDAKIRSGSTSKKYQITRAGRTINKPRRLLH